jgi:hypothetical protein
MKFTSRDRRALLILMVVVVIVGLRWITVTSPNPKPEVLLEAAPTKQLQTILANRRSAAAAVPYEEGVVHRLSTELAVREANLIQAETASEAQAQLLQILKNVTSHQDPPLEVKRIEFSPPRQFSDAYGEVFVSITLECTIDELLNLIADLTAETKTIATNEISLSTGNQTLKTLQSRLTVTGLIHRTLITKPRSP